MAEKGRIPVELVYESSDPNVLATFEKLGTKSVGIVNIHRTFANSPVVFARFIAFAHALRFETILDPAERELAICCVLARHEGDYELKQHRKLAKQAGLSDEQIENIGTASRRTDLYSDRQRAILRFSERTAATVAERSAMPESDIETYLNNRERVELALTLALYIGLAYFTGVLDVPYDG